MTCKTIHSQAMLFGSSEDEHRKDGLRRMRDIVEIVAIVAAGLWAAWIFIYEDKIVPAEAPPEAQFSATMEKVSEHNGLIAVRLETKIRNIGTVRDNFLGVIVAVTGQRVLPSLHPNKLVKSGNSISQRTGYNITKGEVVYTSGYITQQGGATHGGLPLDPGAEETTQYLFYVRSGLYDRIDAYLQARFVKSDRIFPTTFTTRASTGLPDFAPANHGPDISEFDTFIASLDLH